VEHIGLVQLFFNALPAGCFALICADWLKQFVWSLLMAL
jgi:uncharacterized membrane protein YjjB (DUF3815 family)